MFHTTRILIDSGVGNRLPGAPASYYIICLSSLYPGPPRPALLLSFFVSHTREGLDSRLMLCVVFIINRPCMVNTDTHILVLEICSMNVISRGI